MIIDSSHSAAPRRFARGDALWLHTEAGVRTPPLRAALWPPPLLLSPGVRLHTCRKEDGGSGSVRRREGRERRLRPGRLLHAPPDHPQADVVGKQASAATCCGVHINGQAHLHPLHPTHPTHPHLSISLPFTLCVCVCVSRAFPLCLSVLLLPGLRKMCIGFYWRLSIFELARSHIHLDYF